MITTTLNKIRSHQPCANGWKKLLAHLGKTEADDEPLPFATILESNGLDDALWCCRAAPEHDKEWRLFVVWRARQVQHLMTDQRSLDALDVAERFANGQATADQLDAAEDDAWAAARAAAWAAAEAASWAARTVVRDAAWAAARDAARAAAEAAKGAARAAAWAVAGDATRAAAWAAEAAAGGAAREKQEQEFIRIINQ